ncbi:hypothetical protein KCP75_21880 [Salmonella enterica subsp. enterica]|nr:hypothetical protein KCP75_21880 [Salmonella enterica subsp. enterica]
MAPVPLEARLKGEKPPKPAGSADAKRAALGTFPYACYQSLQACGMGIIANGELLDTPAAAQAKAPLRVRISVEHPP